jgi:hypothetical protein
VKQPKRRDRKQLDLFAEISWMQRSPRSASLSCLYETQERPAKITRSNHGRNTNLVRTPVHSSLLNAKKKEEEEEMLVRRDEQRSGRIYTPSAGAVNTSCTPFHPFFKRSK